MRLYKMFGVWMFEKQTEEGEEEVIFKRDNKENWFTLTKKVERAFSDDQFREERKENLSLTR